MNTASEPRRSSHLALAALVFWQMLPATLLTPAIRPLFARLHAGSEGAMHAFMSLNMVAAALIAPWLGARLDKRESRSRWLAALCLSDALLLSLCTLPLPTPLVLTLRFLEGGAHVGAATLLLSESLALARMRGDGTVMGVVGAAIMAAVALGNVFGAMLVGIVPQAPFYAASLCALGVAYFGRGQLVLDMTPKAPRKAGMREIVARLALPLSGVFVARFTVGCLVVTFALFAHHRHNLSDRTIGYLFASMTVPFALLTYPAARWLQRISAERALVVGSIAYACCLIALRYVSAAQLVFVMTLAGAASALMFAAQLAYVVRHAPAGADGRGMAWFNAAGCAGMLLGPIVAGLTIASLRPNLGAISAYGSVFTMAGGSILIWAVGSALWLVSRPRVAPAQARA